MYTDEHVRWWFYEGPLGQFWCEFKDADRWDCIRSYGDHDRLTPKINPECHSGHSALSLALAIRRKLLLSDCEHEYVRRVDGLLSVFSESSSCPRTVLVNANTADIWAAALDDTEHSDVELRIGQDIVKAHAVVLCNASPVLKAMLSAPMLEARSRIIPVPDVSIEALRYLLALIYTGSWEGQEPSSISQLEALDLAHRWQLKHVVEGLEAALAALVPREMQALSPEQQVTLLDKVLEAAVLKELLELRVLCQQLFSTGPHFESAFTQGNFGEASAKYIRKIKGLQDSPGEPGRRTRRRVL